jgi:hypothetical protein
MYIAESNLFDKIKKTHEEVESPDGSVLCEGLWHYKEKIWVPIQYQQAVITQFHDHLIAGHKELNKMLELIQCYYSWPGSHSQVEQYCKSCECCTRMKPTNRPPAGQLQPLLVSEGPWKSISADFITRLPLSHGFDAILVVVD